MPEWLFDMDSPGQFMRRIKTVAVSIPAVTGPHTSHARQAVAPAQLRSRTSSLLGDQYARAEDGEDGRFRDYAGAIQSIVTSSGVDDSGLFEVDLDDDRRLPFEGAGAISTWRIEIPADVPLFDHETISDVVLHLRYTAREAGHLKSAAVEHVTEEVLVDPATSERLFTLPADFAEAWSAFRAVPNDAARRLDLAVGRDDFPYWVNRLGMADELVATFAVTDRDRRKLSLAPAAVELAGDAAGGWTLSVDDASPVFPFLKRHAAGHVMMTVSFAAG